MHTILVTGAAGFIGSNFVRMLLNRNEDARLIAFDKLTYAGNLANLQDLLTKHPSKITFVKGDICDQPAVERAFSDHGINQVVHFAAESHVDRSILGSGPFVQTNAVGTQVLLDVAKAKSVEKFLYVSTDEVYGTLPEDQPDVKFTEETPLQPNSPYSASKAAGDCLVRSYFHTFHMPVLTTRCSNNYGPYHFPEKLIPLFVTNLIEGKKVPLYGDGLNVRDWLHVEDHCDAIWTVLHKGKFGECYNVGGNNELTNRQITETVLKEMNKPWDEFVTYVKDRPGHDRRYAIDASKIKNELGWEPKHRFATAIKTTIQWYKDNEQWWRSIKSGDYLKYYDQQYSSR
ncbi:MAG TPA: dTDP-glucose 4,6-dehydratase [Tepidisphaeraceae bacterium]|jgi:dTDP-glucose 4,6-dehydratase|nr:dTDP-glucose 4,6-dehydratase [Tepidisphaeraceae bacterium]